MSRATQIKALQMIEAIVAAHPNGIGISDIAAEMARLQYAPMNRRALQRRLQKLIETKRLISLGKSIALVYQLAPGAVVERSGLAAATLLSVAEANPYIAVSPEGAHVRDQVRQPLMRRRPDELSR